MGSRQSTRVHGRRLHDGEIDTGRAGQNVEGGSADDGHQLPPHVRLHLHRPRQSSIFARRLFRKFPLNVVSKPLLRIYDKCSEPSAFCFKAYNSWQEAFSASLCQLKSDQLV